MNENIENFIDDPEEAFASLVEAAKKPKFTFAEMAKREQVEQGLIWFTKFTEWVNSNAPKSEVGGALHVHEAFFEEIALIADTGWPAQIDGPDPRLLDALRRNNFPFSVRCETEGTKVRYFVKVRSICTA